MQDKIIKKEKEPVVVMDPELVQRPLVKRPAVVDSPFDLPVEVFADGLERRKQNRKALLDWVRSALVDGIDYGQIHVVGKQNCTNGNDCKNEKHWSKPTLFKPGAEKICGMLGVTERFPSLKDYEQAALNGVDIKTIISKCEIVDTAGNVLADGVGARKVSDDKGDINKSLKMALKSAHIDATLRFAGLSELFTQDVEDMAAKEQASNYAAGRVAGASALPPAGRTEEVAPAGKILSEARASVNKLVKDNNIGSAAIERYASGNYGKSLAGMSADELNKVVDSVSAELKSDRAAWLVKWGTKKKDEGKNTETSKPSPPGQGQPTDAQDYATI